MFLFGLYDLELRWFVSLGLVLDCTVFRGFYNIPSQKIETPNIIEPLTKAPLNVTSIINIKILIYTFFFLDNAYKNKIVKTL